MNPEEQDEAEKKAQQDEKEAAPKPTAAPDLTPEKDPTGGMLKNKNPDLTR